MEPFYKYGLLVAVVFLIVCLIGIGILMQFQNSGMKFPLHPNVCPDKWTTTGEGATLKCEKGSITSNKGTPKAADFLLSTYPSICEKKKWAKTNTVNWDGVSNYNGCN